MTEANSNSGWKIGVIGAQWDCTTKFNYRVPDNDWAIDFLLVLFGYRAYCEEGYAVRPYGYNDAFKGDLFRKRPCGWGSRAKVVYRSDIHPSQVDLNVLRDLQAMALFPVGEHRGRGRSADVGWMIGEPD